MVETGSPAIQLPGSSPIGDKTEQIVTAGRWVYFNAVIDVILKDGTEKTIEMPATTIVARDPSSGEWKVTGITDIDSSELTDLV